jgi:hypothetical protein
MLHHNIRDVVSYAAMQGMKVDPERLEAHVQELHALFGTEEKYFHTMFDRMEMWALIVRNRNRKDEKSVLTHVSGITA